jgi:hypothetical protein
MRLIWNPLNSWIETAQFWLDVYFKVIHHFTHFRSVPVGHGKGPPWQSISTGSRFSIIEFRTDIGLVPVHLFVMAALCYGGPKPFHSQGNRCRHSNVTWKCRFASTFEEVCVRTSIYVYILFVTLCYALMAVFCPGCTFRDITCFITYTRITRSTKKLRF